jgi:NAD-dependent SIR2 family protein deacetylase
MGLSQEQICAGSAAAWAHFTNLQLDGHPYNLETRAYQQELLSFYTMDGRTKYNEVIQTGSQVGKTIGKVIEATHGAIYNKYPQGIIFYFPQRTGVDVFSAGRFQYFLDENPQVKCHLGKTNRNDCRRIGKTNIYFFGAGAGIRVGGEAKDSSAARSTPADWIILDERAIFDEVMALQLNQRLGNSKIARRTDVGTPKIPGDGLDTIYQLSDQRSWQIKCTHCNKYTCPEDEFIEDADRTIIIDSNDIGHLVCAHCKQYIVPWNPGSLWVPRFPKQDVVGYWVSQMLNPNRNLALLLKQWHDPAAYQWTLEEFYRTVLGIPFISAENKLSQQDVFACIGGSLQMSNMTKFPTVMGVDIGKALHYVIGIKNNDKEYELLKVGRAKDQYELHDIAERMNVNFAVIDHDPELHMVEEFQKSEPYPIYLNRYSDTMVGQPVWTNTGNNKGTLKSGRTKWCDKTHDAISGKQIILPRRCREVEEYAYEMTNTVKVLEVDEKSGLSKFRYRQLSNKPDHYFHATLYFLLAASKVMAIPRVTNRQLQTQQAKNEYYL